VFGEDALVVLVVQNAGSGELCELRPRGPVGRVGQHRGDGSAFAVFSAREVLRALAQ
jgi:hypothetical protein